MISQEKLKQLLHYNPETGIFTRLVTVGKSASGNAAGYSHPNGYVYIQLCGKRYFGHRLAWLYVNGCFPDEIDHINRIKHDNRIENLRNVNREQNMQNQLISKNNTSGFKGVSFHKRNGRWQARIKHKGKLINLGFFATPEQASDAYLAAASRMFTHQPAQDLISSGHPDDAGFELWWSEHMPEAVQSVAISAWNAAQPTAQAQEQRVKSFAETHPANPNAKCKCEHWQSCAECHPTAHKTQEPTPLDAQPAPCKPLSEKQIHKLWKNLGSDEGIEEFARAIEQAHLIGEQP